MCKTASKDLELVNGNFFSYGFVYTYVDGADTTDAQDIIFPKMSK